MQKTTTKNTTKMIMDRYSVDAEDTSTSNENKETKKRMLENYHQLKSK